METVQHDNIFNTYAFSCLLFSSDGDFCNNSSLDSSCGDNGGVGRGDGGDGESII